MTARQLRMFQTEDLPLFSGTAPWGNVESLEAELEPEPLLPECEFCRASGIVGLCLFKEPTCCWEEITE